MKPLISVIIPNYNYERYLREAVDSALRQTYDNVEIIVVDDGSADGSREIIESYGGRINALYQENQGVSAARNNGAARGSGEYIAFLDADDIWKPDKLTRQFARFEEDNQVGLTHCSMTLIDPTGIIVGEKTEGQEGNVAEEFLLFERGVVIGAASTGVVSRKAFDSVGGFDVRFSTAADWDFCYRIATKFKIAFVDEPLALYRVHGSNMHSNIKAMEHDMMLGFQKAFASGANADARRCYGNLHKTLAASYFHTGQYADFARQALKSIWKKPLNLGYFAKFPVRRLQR